MTNGVTNLIIRGDWNSDLTRCGISGSWRWLDEHIRWVRVISFTFLLHLPFLTDYISQMERANVCHSLGRCSKKKWVTNIPTECHQYPYSVKSQYVSRLPHLFPASRTVYANEVCFILRSIYTFGYEDLNYVGNLNMVCDSPEGYNSREIDARLRRQRLKKYRQTCYTTTTPPWWRNRGFIDCIYQPGWIKRKHCLLNLVEALPIQPCTHVVSRLPFPSRSYNKSHF